MPRFRCPALPLLLLAALFSPLAGQDPLPFLRKVTPFPVLDDAGTPVAHPFAGGYNRPIPQLADIDGDGLPDLFLQDRAERLIFYRNVSGSGTIAFEWVSDAFLDLPVGAWFKFADIDRDGDLDLFAEKPFGVIRFYRNSGGPANPAFNLVVDTLRDIAGTPIFVDGFSVPDWTDIDCDDDLDLFIGTQPGTVVFYRSNGLDGDGIPLFEYITDTFQNLQIGNPGIAVPARGTERHGANSMSFVDIDADGDRDLFWGDFFSRSLYYIVNSGTCTTPELAIFAEEYPTDNPLLTGGFNVPRFADLDDDGDLDMLVGLRGGFISTNTNAVENLYLFENTGTPQQPQFVLRERQFIDAIDVSRNSVAEPGDLDGDGDLDLLLANELDLDAPDLFNSRIRYFENTGASGPKFTLRDSHYLDYDKRLDLNYSPELADLDGDGDLDLLLGRWDGKHTFYRNTGTPAAPVFTREDEDYQSIDPGNYATPALGDLDGDGDLDLLCGNSVGRLVFYRNTGSAQNPVFQMESDQYAGIDLGDFSHPTLLDYTGDQLVDLVVGSDTGGVAFFPNTGTAQDPAFAATPAWRVTGILRPAPRLADLDGDGDLDLLCGVGGGGMVYFENQEVTGVGEPGNGGTGEPETFVLGQNYPNPFNPETTVGFTMGRAMRITLTVYDVNGGEVATLVDGEMAAGTHTVRWNGRDASGQAVASGVYLYRLRAGQRVQTRKMVLIR